MPSKLLLLHGSRQTGQLLLGRMNKLRKRLSKNFDLEVVAPDAKFPHPDDPNLRQWWSREGNAYVGLEETIQQLLELWDAQVKEEARSPDQMEQNDGFVGILGFSQGARLAHLMALCHHRQPDKFFKGLKFVIMVAGYDASLPEGFNEAICHVPLLSLKRQGATSESHLPIPPREEPSEKITVASLHVWGETDKVISPDQSRAVTDWYDKSCTQTHVHEGGHHVPMRAESIRAYEAFIELQLSQPKINHLEKKQKTDDLASSIPSEDDDGDDDEEYANETNASSSSRQIPSEENAQQQADEIEALLAIFPDEFKLLSKRTSDGKGYEYPIRYLVDLPENDEGIWPPHPVAIQIEYPLDYPNTGPDIQLIHENNVMEFSSSQKLACLTALQEAGNAEEGMPCVLSIINMARDFFESGAMAITKSDGPFIQDAEGHSEPDQAESEKSDDLSLRSRIASLPAASAERISECNFQGLCIAESLLGLHGGSTVHSSEQQTTDASFTKGGLWSYTVGLVGKPSAGKSTFFNAATAFARQRNDAGNAYGGAAMAPHPFTTIDPNIGFCLVPAPPGSCPEESYQGDMAIGSTHGRDNHGQRLIPVLLKDVAGLVPGAYQGRGRGNKFLNDLTDADVLVHVLDASGTADTEGNFVGEEGDGIPSSGASHPLNDLAWIRNELIEWVFNNLLFKWDAIRRRGRSKLTEMFSGYGQPQAMTWSILNAVEKYMEQTEGRDKALDHLEQWDTSDVHRLVSAFLGVRFPMALALNKCDLPSSARNVKDIQEALPVHGAYVGVPLCAQTEMEHVQAALEITLQGRARRQAEESGQLPTGVWRCLQSSIKLREPVLVFPVADLKTYAPLPGFHKHAISDPSLPSAGMITCLKRANGFLPTLWDESASNYNTTSKSTKDSLATVAIRDCLVMKPGSTVEDVYVTLKHMGALSGEFVRAEGCGELGSTAKPVPKQQVVSRSVRILKIMTNKRTAWQNK